jgi:hypothetical protein
VPALPWKAYETVDPDTECTVMASRLPLRSHAKIPGFVAATMRIRRQLAGSTGLIGYALNAELSAKTFWTLSAWRSQQDLDQFARADPHATDVGKIQPNMEPTTFVFWTARAGDLPISWDEVRRRIADEQAGGAPGQQAR